MRYAYKKYKTQALISVHQLVTIHYLKNVTRFETVPEAHNFWELIFADSGSATVVSNDNRFILSTNELYFHMPGEVHSFTVGEKECSLFIISFVCNSDLIVYLAQKKYHIQKQQKKCLSALIDEAKEAFVLNHHELLLRNLSPNPDSYLGAEQLVRSYLEQFLIFMLRIEFDQTKKVSLEYALGSQPDDYLTAQVINYLGSNISKKITIDDIAGTLRYSRSYLSRVFKKESGYSIMEYLNKMRISQAKTLLLNGNDSITQIADTLGFQNIHYFSRVFKLETGKSPSDFRNGLDQEVTQGPTEIT